MARSDRSETYRSAQVSILRYFDTSIRPWRAYSVQVREIVPRPQVNQLYASAFLARSSKALIYQANWPVRRTDLLGELARQAHRAAVDTFRALLEAGQAPS